MFKMSDEDCLSSFAFQDSDDTDDAIDTYYSSVSEYWDGRSLNSDDRTNLRSFGSASNVSSAEHGFAHRTALIGGRRDFNNLDRRASIGEDSIAADWQGQRKLRSESYDRQDRFKAKLRKPDRSVHKEPRPRHFNWKIQNEMEVDRLSGRTRNEIEFGHRQVGKERRPYSQSRQVHEHMEIDRHTRSFRMEMKSENGQFGGREDQSWLKRDHVYMDDPDDRSRRFHTLLDQRSKAPWPESKQYHPRNQGEFNHKSSRNNSIFQRGFQESRGARHGHHPRRLGHKHFNINDIQGIEDCTEALLKLTSCLDDFKSYMQCDSISTENAAIILKTLSKVLECDSQRHNVIKILHGVGCSRFLDTHLLNLVTKAIESSTLRQSRSMHDVISIIDNIYILIKHICETLPSYASRGYLLLHFIKTQLETASEQNPDLKESLQKCKELVNTCSENKKTEKKSGLNGDNEMPPDDYRYISVFPEKQDLDLKIKPFPRANKSEGSYQDLNDYLDVQFRLLREDYMRPLRDGIKEYKRMKKRGENVSKTADVRIYQKVRLLQLVCSESLEHRLQFDVTSFRKVCWQSTKRLLYGSLVCLNLDDFESIFIAVVTGRDLKDLEKGIVQVHFQIRLEEMLQTPPDAVFTMVEASSTFFEAYRHVLTGLQQIDENLPFTRYIIECQKEIKPPSYLYEGGKIAFINISAILKKNSGFNKNIQIIKPNQWPEVEDTELNESQCITLPHLSIQFVCVCLLYQCSHV